MLKRLLQVYDYGVETWYDRYNGNVRTKNEWNLLITVVHVCSKLGNGLKQYYADLLMLELIQQGRL